MQSVICSFPIADLKEHHIYSKFCLKSVETALEMYEVLRTVFDDSATERT